MLRHLRCLPEVAPVNITSCVMHEHPAFRITVAVTLALGYNVIVGNVMDLVVSLGLVTNLTLFNVVCTNRRRCWLRSAGLVFDLRTNFSANGQVVERGKISFPS